MQGEAIRTDIGLDYARFDQRTRVKEAVARDAARKMTRVLPRERTAVRTKINVRPAMLFAYFMGIVLCIVFSYATLSEFSRENAKLTSKIKAAELEHGVLMAAYENRIDMEEVAYRAVNELGMVEPGDQQITYINMSCPEKAEVLSNKITLAMIGKKMETSLQDMLAYFK